MRKKVEIKHLKQDKDCLRRLYEEKRDLLAQSRMENQELTKELAIARERCESWVKKDKRKQKYIDSLREEYEVTKTELKNVHAYNKEIYEENRKLRDDLNRANERIAEQNRYWAKWSAIVTKMIEHLNECVAEYNAQTDYIKNHRELKEDGEC